MAAWLTQVRGLKFQIVLWTVLPLTLVLIGVAFTGVYSHEQTMRALVGDRDRALATAASGQIQDLIERRALMLQTLAGDPTFTRGDDSAQLQALSGAGAVGGAFPGGLAAVDRAEEIVMAGGPSGQVVDHQALVLALAADIMASQQLAGQTIADGAGEPAILLGVPIGAGAPATGALIGAMPLAGLRLDDVLDRVQLGGHGMVYVADTSGLVLAHVSRGGVQPGEMSYHADLAAALSGTGPAATVYENSEGERMSLAYAPVEVTGLDWRVIVEQPWHEVMGPVLRYSQIVPLVAALAAVVSLLTLYYGVRSIVQPLQALGQQAERVAWGDFSATGTPVGGVREIEDLRQTLDQMARRIQSYQRGMHDYIAAMTQGQEEERRRLARELHDDTAQALIALGQRVEMAQKALPADAARASERLATVRAMISETLEGVRRFSRDLRPTYLDDLGFVPALEMLVQANGRPAPTVELKTEGDVRRLRADMELAAYRIVQEALNNIYQHGQAEHAWIEARFEPAALVLQIRDDGRGFDAPRLPESMARQGHFGLMGIQERALLYGGKLTIQSAPGEGTLVWVQLPYSADGEPRVRPDIPAVERQERVSA